MRLSEITLSCETSGCNEFKQEVCNNPIPTKPPNRMYFFISLILQLSFYPFVCSIHLAVVSARHVAVLHHVLLKFSSWRSDEIRTIDFPFMPDPNLLAVYQIP